MNKIHNEEQILNFVDLETTGLRFNKDKIIEIYITKELNGETIKTFHSLVNPGFTPDRFILQLTNIPLEQIRSAPTFAEIADEVFDFIKDGILFAHNARFDYSFLKNEFANLGIPLDLDYCCTVKMFKHLYPDSPRHNLDTLRKVVSLDEKDKHRAESDTKVIRKFYYDSIHNFGERRVQDSIRYSIRKSAIPKTLLDYDFNSISEGPGVYIFYGKDDYPLYVGMSKSLRRRVRDHLYSDISYAKDSLINQQLTRIETIPTAGVLGAALRESHLIKKIEPLFNRKLRRNSNLLKIKEIVSDTGHKTIQIDSKSGFEKKDLQNTLFITQSLRSSKEYFSTLVKEHGLCSKLLGLEKSKGACFAYQLGQCKGACINKFSAEEYNRVFDDVFQNFRIQSWPFDNPILIREENTGMQEEFLFDNWVFLGSSVGLGMSNEVNKYSFNFDTYKIIAGHINKLYHLIKEVDPNNLDTSKYLDFF